jgi:hypothetical protein
MGWGFAPNWSAGIEYDHLFRVMRTIPLQLIPSLPVRSIGSLKTWIWSPFASTIASAGVARTDLAYLIFLQ